MAKMDWKLKGWLGAFSAGIVGALTGCGGESNQDIGSFTVLSTRAELVSSGDALVEFMPAQGVDLSVLKLDVNGTDVTKAFSLTAEGRFIGLVGNMRNGANLLNARTADGRLSSIEMRNHARGGPTMYGPQVAPWTCDPGALDPQCNRPVSYAYLYKSTGADQTSLLPYSLTTPPTDVAKTVTDAGATVPFIVRVETGVIDRDYYNVAVLFDPSKTWGATAPQSGWNRKVLFTHGAGYGLGYRQLNSITSANVLNLYALGKGFAVMSTALNDTGHNGNLVAQAEAMLMLKEHFIENYGEIRYSIGSGSSGGAIAQQWVANAYPGIYDGIIVAASFPDIGTTAIEIEDCGLLNRYLTDATKWGSGISWSTEARFAAAGHSGDVCTLWADRGRALGLGVNFGYPQVFDPTHRGTVEFPGIAPTAIGGCDAPPDAIYDPLKRPKGVRCTGQDYVVGIMGRRASDGFANRPYSNTGVQYGLAALESGKITPSQFVDLNVSIGSHDIDYVFQARRTSADKPAIAATYRSGWINSGNGMSSIPILDVRAPDLGSHHHQYRSWAMRERLQNAQGHSRNQVIWFNSGKSMDQALDEMDKWLFAVRADRSTASLSAKVVANRPASLLDLCGEKDGTNLSMQACTNGAQDGSTRMGAGSPLADDVLECRLAPLDRGRYKAAFSDSQWAQMQTAFPLGVCDYSAPGLDQQRTLPWLMYVDPLGAAVEAAIP